MADPVVPVPAGGPSRIDLGSAVLASIYAGSIAGGTTVAVGAFVSGSGPLAEFVITLVSASVLGSMVGAVVALLPGVTISLLLQLSRTTRIAPIVGALLGAVLPVSVVVTLANENTSSTAEKVISLLPLAVCGALGGGIGGIALHRYTTLS